MEWVLLVSLQWIVSGSPTPPTTTEIQSFASEDLCNKAAEAIRNELNAPLAAKCPVRPNKNGHVLLEFDGPRNGTAPVPL